MTLYKRILFLLILSFLGMFLIQGKFTLFEVRPLDGTKEHAVKPHLTIRNFLKGTYQDSLDKYANENAGFRPSLVRLISQINFTVFRTTHAPGVVPGKKKHLFIESYILDYIGDNFVGRIKADDVVTKIKCVQDSLKAFNIDLLVVFAPGKASFYPNLIPDNYLARKKDSTNYSYYRSQLTSKHVNFIDLNSFFIQNRNTFAYPIYPEYGTHWTPYAYAMAFDSILHYIEAKRNIRLPELDYSQIQLKDSLKEREFDIGILLNLIRTPKHLPMPYPRYKFDYTQVNARPNVLAVGDSYWWCMVGDDLPFHVFKEDEYWFYNRDIYKRNSKQDIGVKDVSFARETANRDVIILMATEATLHMFPYGFIEKAYDVYCLSPEQKREMLAAKIKNDAAWMLDISRKAKEAKISEQEQLNKEIEYALKKDYMPVKDSDEHYRAIILGIMDKIKRDQPWYDKVISKSKENGVPPEIQLEIDAWYLYNADYGSAEAKEKLRDIRQRIYNTPEWIKQIEVKAKEKNITLEEMIELDALYIYDMENKSKK